jgi:hypothetical protein
MLDAITPNAIASEIRLLREDCGYQGVFVIVEGETDVVFYSNYIDISNCQLRALGDKSKVLELIGIMEHEGDIGCIAIVDADYFNITKEGLTSASIFMTDTHDVETLIFMSPALEKILREYISIDKLDNFAEKHIDIRYSLLKIASSLGIIRWVNYRWDMGVCFYMDSFKKIPIEWHEAIDIHKFIVDNGKLIDIIFNGDYQFKKRFIQKIKITDVNGIDNLDLCNGHDVIYVTVFFIKNHGKQNLATNLDVFILSRNLRLAYEDSYFRNTRLYSSLLDWQSMTGKKILQN